ncbi:MAG TPA: serine/threonine-protein kinase, partial [Acidimicrobiia bacterium]|nr:serine/threonine-protein kinase [Acidimicrobiia bacterium]
MDVINDRYELLEVIASGGMATVWKSRDTRLDRLVALKRPHPGPPGDGSAERLIREARAAASLSHPNLITVYDFGEDDAGPYLVMELVDGPTLQGMADGLESAEVIDLGTRLADALAAIHAAGIVHRDVKPANVIMSQRGPLLTDFGIATDTNSTAELTQPGMVVATPSYAAPEVLAGEPPTSASDVYSLGVVIDELIRKTGANLDEPLERAVAAALAVSPADRPDAAGLADALGRGASTHSSVVPSEGTTMILETTPSPPVTQSADKDREPRPAWMWAAGVLVLLALGLIALGLAVSGDD